MGRFSKHTPVNVSRPMTKFPTMKTLTPLVSPFMLSKTLRNFLNICLQTPPRVSNPPSRCILFPSKFLRLLSLLSPIHQLLRLLNPRPQPMTPPSRNSPMLLTPFSRQMFPSKKSVSGIPNKLLLAQAYRDELNTLVLKHKVLNDTVRSLSGIHQEVGVGMRE